MSTHTTARAHTSRQPATFACMHTLDVYALETFHAALSACYTLQSVIRRLWRLLMLVVEQLVWNVDFVEIYCHDVTPVFCVTVGRYALTCVSLQGFLGLGRYWSRHEGQWAVHTRIVSYLWIPRCACLSVDQVHTLTFDHLTRFIDQSKVSARTWSTERYTRLGIRRYEPGQLIKGWELGDELGVHLSITRCHSTRTDPFIVM